VLEIFAAGNPFFAKQLRSRAFWMNIKYVKQLNISYLQLNFEEKKVLF